MRVLSTNPEVRVSKRQMALSAKPRTQKIVKTKISSFILILMPVAGFFPGHNAVAKPVFSFSKSSCGMETPGDAAPRKKPDSATKNTSDPLTPVRVGNYGQAKKMLVCSTSYSHDESLADDYSAEHIGACKFKLQYPGKEKIGIAAVDPNGDIPLGSIILARRGNEVMEFIAGDAGGEDVVNKTASKARAKKRGLPETSLLATAQVCDFFMPGNEPVGDDEWTEIVVIPYQGAKPFVRLNEESQKAYLQPEVWENVLAKNSGTLNSVGSFVAMR